MQHHSRPSHHGLRRFVGGITLMELMIVMVIVGILSAIGYPAYVDYATRAKRKDGATLLQDAAARMERYYYDNNRYSDVLTELGYAAGTVLSAERYYTLTAAIGSTGSINTSYTLTATPNAAYPFSDADCGALILDHRGDQRVSVTTDATVAQECWVR